MFVLNDASVQQMERNEDRQVIQERPSSRNSPIPLFHYYALLRVDHDVRFYFSSHTPSARRGNHSPVAAWLKCLNV
jgi:hypothetical protein